jgi:hypothetical protein
VDLRRRSRDSATRFGYCRYVNAKADVALCPVRIGTVPVRRVIKLRRIMTETIVSARDEVQKDEIRYYFSGNRCRCGASLKNVNAAQVAGRTRATRREP